MRGWRALGLVWAVAIAVTAGGAGVLQWLGPPRRPAEPAPPPTRIAALPHPTAPRPATARPAARPHPALPPGLRGPQPPPPAATAIASPMPSLLTPLPGHPGRFLPRIGADGTAPMHAYAAGFDPAEHGPRVALLLAGVGLDHTASLAAIAALPGAVSLAVSPYARHLGPVLKAARAAGHEFLISLPMEPSRYPLNDPGPNALLSTNTPQQNQAVLDWVLSRVQGYVGATGALGLTSGSRFAADGEDFHPLLRRLAALGLLYLDPRPGAAPLPDVWGRAVDVVIDRPADPASIAAALTRLDRLARQHGSALGLVQAVRPRTISLLQAWVHGLAAKGLVLTPASALALPPPAPLNASAAK
ncbi:MAG: divergent polysaccharide deacetylase family protein [Acetobacteraceae bacterium]